MKKVFLLVFISMFFLTLLTSCDAINEIFGKSQNTACEHEWAMATCQAPKTCDKCGATRGDIGDHNYSEATCTSPEKCETCGIWRGLALGHKYSAGSCTEPKTCEICGDTKGGPVHDYTAATCTNPKTCSKCKTTEGEALGHKLKTVVTEPTCTMDGSDLTFCTVCDFTYSMDVISRIDHSELPFVYNGDATASADGTVTAACPYCSYAVTETLEGSSALISEAFAGKKISILGDSISTYLNFSSGIAASTTNSTIFNNIVWYGYNSSEPDFGGSSVDSTWWQTTINALGATRLVNNSNSGESVYNAVQGRCMQLHDDTGSNAGETPDIIFIYLGTNDNHRIMGDAASLKMADIKQKGDDPSYTPSNLAEAYAVMLYRIQKTYPNAEIYCLTNLERSDMDPKLTQAVSQVIRDVVTLFDGIYLADIGRDSGIERGNSDYEIYIPKDQGGKSIHPGVEGMKAIANVLLQAIIENSRYIAEDFDALIPNNNE